MPYIRKGKKYSRMTEVIGGTECEALPWIDQTYAMDRPRRGTLAAIIGTLVHFKFEEYELNNNMSKAYKTAHLDLNEDERLMLKQLLINHRKQQKIQNNSQERFNFVPEDQQKTQYELFNEEINDLYANFLAFQADNPHKAIYVEEKRFWDQYLVAGTVDLIAVFKLRGVLREKEVPYTNPPVKRIYFYEEPTNPNAEEMEVITLLDWKSSKMKLPAHKGQLGGYHLMWEALGEFDKLRKSTGLPINNQCFSVLLGKRARISQKEIALHNGKPPIYQFFKYDSDYEAFFLGLGVRVDPRPLTIGINGNVGLKGKCMVCSDVYYCPDNINIPVVTELGSYIPLKPFNMKELSQLKMLLANIHANDLGPLKKKIESMYEELLELSNIQDSTIYEILENVGIDARPLLSDKSTQFLTDLLIHDTKVPVLHDPSKNTLK